MTGRTGLGGPTVDVTIRIRADIHAEILRRLAILRPRQGVSGVRPANRSELIRELIEEEARRLAHPGHQTPRR